MSLPARRLAAPRAELLDTYARPYRRWLPVALRGYGAHYAVVATGLLAVAWAIAGALAPDAADALGIAASIAAMVTLGVVLWGAAHGASIIHGRVRDWRPGDGDLARARRRRPHRHDADPDVAHDEYAVAVSDDGRLVTFAYTPLAAYEDVAPEAILIPGVPRYEAIEAAVAHFDPADAGRAAEQLAEAQDHAARLEAAAIDRARAELADREDAMRLRGETESTAAALRGITGQ